MSENGIGAAHAAYVSQNGYASLEQLRASAPMKEQDLDLPGGVRIRIRMLSRYAQHQINKEAKIGQPEQDLALAEYLTWRYAFIAPVLTTAAEAEALFIDLHPKTAQAISDAILELSGLSEVQQTAADAAFQPAHAG